MEYRKLGRTDILVSEIGLGSWQFGGNTWGKKPSSTYLTVIANALENGVNFIDTGLEYGDGESERIIGKALRTSQNGKNVKISTKIPPKSMQWAPPPHHSISDYYPPAWIYKCCEESLRNLNRDSIDVLLLHTWNFSWAHEENWFDALSRLKTQGKIKSFGISVSDKRCSEANVQAALDMVDVIEVVFNIFEQEPIYSLFPLAEKKNIGIIARCPFSSGALAGYWQEKMTFPEDDWRNRWTDANWVKEQYDMLKLVQSVTGDLNLPRLALQFILRDSRVSTVIPGTSNPSHAVENAKASEKHEFNQEIFNQLNELWISGQIHGVYNGG